MGGHRRPPLQGADGARARLDEGQDHRAAGAQVLGVDWRLHPLVALHLPADVDLEAGVRRVGPLDRPPQVLLGSSSSAHLSVEWEVSVTSCMIARLRTMRVLHVYGPSCEYILTHEKK